MRIESIGHPQSKGIGQLSNAHGNIKSDSTTRLSADAERFAIEPISTTTAVERSTETESDDHDGGRAKGVLRLLEAGHFNGVADVRLRINFFDELSARSSEATKEAVGDQVTQLSETLAGTAQQLLEPFATDEESQAALTELLASFEAELQQAADDALAAENFDLSAFTATTQAAFESFIEQAASILAPPTTDTQTSVDEAEPVEIGAELDDAASTGRTTDGTSELKTLTTDGLVVEGAAQLLTSSTITESADADVIAADTTSRSIDDTTDLADAELVSATDVTVVDTSTTTESSDTLDDAIALLTAAFHDAIVSLTESFESTTTLDDPAPLHGNGGAYDKFLAIYDGLRYGSTELDRTV